ncbi:MAG: hypothetical protein ACXVB9_02110 [Bdellovibrionota bacterium]
MLTLLLLATRALADDGAVNLADMGMDGFTPYIVERNPYWIALPVAAIALLLLHLKRTRKRRN